MLQHRLLIEFRNTSLGNTVQQDTPKHFYETSPQSCKTLFLYSYLVYFILRNKSKKCVYNEIKDLIFEVSNLSITFLF